MIKRIIVAYLFVIFVFAGISQMVLAADDIKVNFYGVADVGVESIKYGDNSKTSVVSSTVWGSYLGMSATKALDSNGLSVSTTIEVGINFDDGTTDSLLEDRNRGIFARQAKVDLNSSWGRFGIGRQYSPYFWLAVMTDPDLLGAYSPTLQVAMGHPTVTWPHGRISNSVSYKTPSYQGLTVELNYGLNENNKSVTHSKTANVMYMNDKIIGGVAWQRQELAVDDNDLFQIAGSYNFDLFKLSASYNGFRGANDYDSDGYTASVTIPIGKHSFIASGSMRKTNQQDGGACGLLIGYNHTIAKGFQLWGRAGMINNEVNADYSLNYVNYEADFKTGDDSRGIAGGILFTF